MLDKELEVILDYINNLLEQYKKDFLNKNDKSYDVFYDDSISNLEELLKEYYGLCAELSLEKIIKI